MLSEIVKTMSKNAPTDGETTNVNINDFNLDAFVPKKPYFNYIANEPYQPCSTEVDYVVYIPSSGPIGISEDILKLLQTIIRVNQYEIKTGPQLFYNEKGPSAGTGSDDIYIDCKPVGMSDEEINVVTGPVAPTSNILSIINSMINSPYFIMIFGTLLVIFLLYMINTVIGSPKKSVDTVVSSVKDIVKKGGSKIL